MRDISNESEIHGIINSVLKGDMFHFSCLFFPILKKKKEKRNSVSIQKETTHTCLVYEDETFSELLR